MRKVITAFMILAVLGTAGYFGYKLYSDYKAEKDFTTLMAKGATLKQLHKQNEDCVGIIKIKGTNINYPVMQTSKDYSEFYLRRNFKKQYSVAGTPFLSSWSTLGKSNNYLIFGHNIRSGSMFHDLLEYENKKFWKKHKLVDFEDIKTGKHRYRIFSVMKTETYSFDYPKYGFMTGKKYFDRYVDICKRLSSYNTKIIPRYKTQLLTLSTCSYHTDGGRMVVVAEQII